MRAIMESIFSIAYMATAGLLGILIIRNRTRNRQDKLFGIMTLVLVCGDSFHLVPRIIAAFASEQPIAALGFGKLVTSITMTAFYLLLYHVWRERYGVKGETSLTAIVYALAAVRIALCMFPQNEWLSADSPVSWGIYRNIPFAILGLVIIFLFYSMAKQKNDRSFRFLWLAVLLSFAFYIPVVLWADAYSLVGMLMLPKTCAYVWIVWMGYSDLKRRRTQ